MGGKFFNKNTLNNIGVRAVMYWGLVIAIFAFNLVLWQIAIIINVFIIGQAVWKNQFNLKLVRPVLMVNGMIGGFWIMSKIIGGLWTFILATVGILTWRLASGWKKFKPAHTELVEIFKDVGRRR